MKLLKYIANESIVLKTFLYEQGISRKSLSAIKQNGALLVNEQPVTVRKILRQHDVIKVYLPDEVPSAYLEPFEMDLNILFEDEWLIIISKPPLVSTAPSRDHPHHSLVEAVLFYMQKNNEKTIPHIVTRLDRGTSGIIIFTKHQLIHHMLSQIEIKKYYLAVVCGVLKRQNGQIIEPIGRSPHSIIERIVSTEGKFAQTNYELLDSNETHSLLKLQLLTGRTHQIRVHLAHIGYPILGDSLYGKVNNQYKHQLLQCYIVDFCHPITKENILIKDDLHYHL
ncbi:RluA family pseudouridine synthase [Mammaliicoccus stepanovicii]|uniref:Pseudouridine synthase n=1 Tax=Mammaliicoccus stepanovicii TaxID=643214 RepID=A0A239ZSG0_9STAP|nr:RluA family pseudouridine synthase [Mammaliicoccus stepanovicii]PNZ77091.1 RluA family pseudouridine synthase [Mammaliicoccus stepanovicii]GGI38817.1 RNA pseudouridine synthase [Mammaliicoccus stepanovicii]SNV73947.1 ribosomal large subunit pseudouridine synthase D [Mammaliicoccus stepanovicii]